MELDQFNLAQEGDLTRRRWARGRQYARAGEHLLRAVSSRSRVAARADPQQDMVVLHVRLLRRAASGEYDLTPDQLFSTIEQLLFHESAGDGGKGREAGASGRSFGE